MKTTAKQINARQELTNKIHFCANMGREGLKSRISDPEELALWLDWMDIFEEKTLGSYDYCVEVMGRECECKTIFEEDFLLWLNLYLNRGLGFNDAWISAQKALTKTSDGRITKYELNEGDQYDLELWIERLSDFGMSQESLEPMAKEILQLLRRIYLSTTGSWFSEEDELRSRELLGDLWNDKDEYAVKTNLT